MLSGTPINIFARMKRILFVTMALLNAGAMYAGPRFEHNHSDGGAMIVLFIILGLIYLFKKK